MFKATYKYVFNIQVLDKDQIKSATIESLRFMNNKIKIIDNDMFG